VTDAVADLLWTPSPDGDENLRREGVPPSRIECVGNIMLDSFEMLRARIAADATPASLGVSGRRYGVVTLHRPSNVDDPDTLRGIVAQLKAAARSVDLVFPVHPRTRRRLLEFGIEGELSAAPGIHLVEPLSYVQFMGLVSGAVLAITDSGGLQEETTYLGIPCLTVRPNTERPITLTEGTNRLVSPIDLLDNIAQALTGRWPTGRRPRFWDGQTAGRCVASLRARLQAPAVSGGVPV
jgi:UDP-N-acetylglucosamine 2-epimerase (non-hydrolysing)